MKFKNVKRGEKYILKGGKKDWYFIDGEGNKVTPSTAHNFEKGQEVITDSLKDIGNYNENVNVKSGASQYMFIHCKFLKKIKDKK